MQLHKIKFKERSINPCSCGPYTYYKKLQNVKYICFKMDKLLSIHISATLQK